MIFECFNEFTLVGDKYLLCKNGRWDSTVPICASKYYYNWNNWNHRMVPLIQNRAAKNFQNWRMDLSFTKTRKRLRLCSVTAGIKFRGLPTATAMELAGIVSWVIAGKLD